MFASADKTTSGPPRCWKAVGCVVVLALCALSAAGMALTGDATGAGGRSAAPVDESSDEAVPDLERLMTAASRLDAEPPTAADYADAMEDRTGPTLLFVQDALSGTFTPAETAGEHWLELHGAEPLTLWFENRPGNQTGTMTNQEMLDQFFAPPDDGSGIIEPPNAAVDAWDPATGADVVVGLKLLDGSWDPDTGVLRYRVTELVDVGPAPEGETRIGGSLPASFDEVGLFIDDGVGLAPTPQGKLIGDIYTVVSTFVGYITDRHTCSAVVENVSGDTLRWDSDDSKGTDSWRQNPTRDFTWAAYWTTSAGFMRGCWNWVLYKGPRGTVAVGTSNPWSGSTDSLCDTTGAYGCVYQMTGQGTTHGNTQIVTYCVYDDLEGERYCLAD